MVRVAALALAMSGCALAWEAADPAPETSSASGTGSTSSGTSDQAIEVACVAVPDPAPAIAGVSAGDIDAWHDFGRSDPAFIARVMAYAPGLYTRPSIYWAGSVGYAPCSGGKTYPDKMTFVVLP